MKVTAACFAGIRDVTLRRWKLAWLKDGQFYDKPAQVPPALIQKGVEIVDMKEHMQPKHKKWTPPVPDDPRWAVPVPLEDRPDWKPDPAFSFSRDTQIYEGVSQACLIAKAQHFEGLPPGVERLVGAVDTADRDVLLQRSIMLSQRWHTDEDKLPRRKQDPEKPVWTFAYEFGILPYNSSLIVAKNLLRMCQINRADFPSLASRKQIAEPLLDSFVMYKDQPIVQREQLDLLLTSDTWLPPFGDEDLVDASVAHKLPDMWPVLPTVDFTETNNYQLHNYPGFRKEHKYWCPHTIVQIPKRIEMTDSQYQASQILTSLFLTAAVARRRFGNDVRHLPEPVSVQHVLVNQSKLYLSFFQLNTLDLDSSTGVKNFAWTGQPGKFFNKTLSKPWLEEPEWKTFQLDDFQGSPFEPLLAAYLYGLPELESR